MVGFLRGYAVTRHVPEVDREVTGEGVREWSPQCRGPRCAVAEDQRRPFTGCPPGDPPAVPPEGLVEYHPSMVAGCCEFGHGSEAGTAQPKCRHRSKNRGRSPVVRDAGVNQGIHEVQDPRRPEASASTPGTKTRADQGSERGPDGNSNEWTAEESKANGSPNQSPDPQGVVHRCAAGKPLPFVGLLKCGDIKLAHPEHGLHGALGPLRIGAADQRSKH